MSPHPTISVHKFGGVALGDGDSVCRVADLVASIRGGTLPIASADADSPSPARPVIAVSAMAGVTNELL
ncbi:MAG TPA: hypothetical protein VIR34_07630, partial [Gemmatimonadaceae bacterium]